MVVNYVQQQSAAYVGKLVADGALIEGSPAHAALHALSACAGAAAQGSSCGAAAFGAATASVVSSLLEDSAEVLASEQKEARKNLIATLVTGVAAASGQAAAANTAALIEMENNSNAKNAVKAAINDAKDYVGKKGKEGLEKAVELLEKIEIKPLVEKQKEIGKFLDEAAARGGLTEGEIAVLGIIYAANEALFPTSALDLIPGAGKAVGKTGILVKAGMKAEDAAKVAVAEAKAAAQAGNYGKVGGHDVHAQAGANGGVTASKPLVTHQPLDDLLIQANKPINDSGLSQVARAWDKHDTSRPGGTFDSLAGNATAKNEYVNNWLTNLLTNPQTTRTNLPGGGVEYRLPNGQGARFESNGAVNLVDPRRP